MARRKKKKHEEIELPKVECPVCKRMRSMMMMTPSFFAKEEKICWGCFTERRDKKKKKFIFH